MKTYIRIPDPSTFRRGATGLVAFWLLVGLPGLVAPPGHSLSAVAQDRAALPSTPGRSLPLTRPTALPRTPLTRQQVERHQQRINELHKTHADAFAPTPEHMLSGQEIRARDEAERQQGLVLAKIMRGDPNRRDIALTFDDGPHPAFTPRLLDLLRMLNVHATFFMVGKKVDQAPYLVERMVREGHEVGNHTYDHINLSKLPDDMVENEIRMDNDAIYRACGVEPVVFRPPGGQYDAETIRIAERLRLTTVFWTDDPADYVNPGESVIEERLLPHIRNGAIILLHDGVEQTWDLLPDLVARLRRAGYHFVTVSEMIQRQEAMPLAHARP